MSDKQPWFVSERALALASLFLTSRQDIAVQLAPNNRGIDILAEVLQDGGSSGRFFGVQVDGQVDLANPNDVALPRFTKKMIAKYSLPLCDFLFDVRTNVGYFRWMIEPIVFDDEPKLRRNSKSEWQPLNDDAANHITGKVSAYYDALSMQLKV